MANSSDANITRVVVMDQTLPAPWPTHRVEVRRITIPAGRATGLHIHNGPVFGNIEGGEVLFQIENGPEQVLRSGDTFYEPEGVRIAHFDALREPVTFLAYFPLPEGVEAELFFPDAS